MKFEYVGGLLYAEISIFHDQEVKLRAMIDTGSAGTAADIDKFKINPHRRGSRLAYIEPVRKQRKRDRTGEISEIVE